MFPIVRLAPIGRASGNFRRKSATRRLRHPIHLSVSFLRGRCSPRRAGGRNSAEVGGLIQLTRSYFRFSVTPAKSRSKCSVGLRPSLTHLFRPASTRSDMRMRSCLWETQGIASIKWKSSDPRAAVSFSAARREISPLLKLAHPRCAEVEIHPNETARSTSMPPLAADDQKNYPFRNFPVRLGRRTHRVIAADQKIGRKEKHPFPLIAPGS